MVTRGDQVKVITVLAESQLTPNVDGRRSPRDVYTDRPRGSWHTR